MGLLARIGGYPVHDLHDKVLARIERPRFDRALRKQFAGLGIEQATKRDGRDGRTLGGT